MMLWLVVNLLGTSCTGCERKLQQGFLLSGNSDEKTLASMRDLKDEEWLGK
jgi:hypothetical protein